MAIARLVVEESAGARIHRAAMLAAILTGESPVRGTCPVATVVISGGGAGDQSVGSPEVKVPVGKAKAESDPSGGRANRQVVAQANWSEAPKSAPREKRICGITWKCRDLDEWAKASVGSEGTG